MSSSSSTAPRRPRPPARRAWPRQAGPRPTRPGSGSKLRPITAATRSADTVSGCRPASRAATSSRALSGTPIRFSARRRQLAVALHQHARLVEMTQQLADEQRVAGGVLAHRRYRAAAEDGRPSSARISCATSSSASPRERDPLERQVALERRDRRDDLLGAAGLGAAVRRDDQQRHALGGARSRAGAGAASAAPPSGGPRGRAATGRRRAVGLERASHRVEQQVAGRVVLARPGRARRRTRAPA